MATDTTLNTTVLINGGTPLDTTKDSKLLDRELYVDYNGYIYVGKTAQSVTGVVNYAKPSKIRAGSADEITHNTGLFSLNVNSTTPHFGGLKAVRDTNSMYIDGSDTTIKNLNANNASLSGVTLYGASLYGGSVNCAVKASSLVLSSNNYSSTLPSPDAYDEGALFFVYNEQELI